MRRPLLAIAIAVAAAAASLPFAQAGAYDIVVVQSFDSPIYQKAIEGFQQTSGGTVTTYTLNKDKKIEQGDFDEIKNKRPAAILAVGPSALTEILAKKPPKGVPVVFAAVTDKPEDQNPDAGVLMNVPMDKQLEALTSIAPNVKTVGIIYNPAKTQYFVDDLIAAAKIRKITVVMRQVSSKQDAVKELSALLPTVDAYLFAPDTSIHGEILEKSAATLSLKHRIPIVGFKGSQCANGFLFASEMDPLEMGKQAGDVTKALLAGRKPSPLYVPVKKFNLVVNSKVATQLGLSIPPEIAKGAKLCSE